MASIAAPLFYLIFVSALISPISSKFHLPIHIPSRPHLPIPTHIPIRAFSPCSIIGDLLSFLGPCDAVVAPLAPCLGAMVFKNGKSNKDLTKACCDGAALVAKGRGTQVGKLAVCGCLKDVLAQISLITAQDLKGVLDNCSGVSLPVPNSNTSCVSGV